MSEQNKDNDFPNGMIVKNPHANAPDFVINSISFKVDEFKQWLDDNEQDGWVNIQTLKSQGGKQYAKLNDWNPNKDSSTPQQKYQSGQNTDFQKPVHTPPNHTENQKAFDEMPSFDASSDFDIDDAENDIPF